MWLMLYTSAIFIEVIYKAELPSDESFGRFLQPFLFV